MHALHQLMYLLVGGAMGDSSIDTAETCPPSSGITFAVDFERRGFTIGRHYHDLPAALCERARFDD